MEKYKQIKKRIFDIIQIGQRGDFPSFAFDIFIVVVIVLNILVLILETFNLPAGLLNALHIVEIVTIGIFIVEYILRIWTADLLYPADSKGKARLKFLISFDGIVDLLTIIPAFFLTGFSAFRMLRVVRIFHLFRINATYDSFNVITTVLHHKRKQILFSVFIIAMLMLASSLCMYSVEHEAQPEVFTNAFTGLWWSVSAILTVGYGDVYPITLIGQIMAIIISILGVGVVAIPTGIISAGFVEQHTILESGTSGRASRALPGDVLHSTSQSQIGVSGNALSDKAASSAPVNEKIYIISEKENICERILRDREATDPETRRKFDRYLAELLKD
ncbi:MAG: ion transporter [Lachnospiraceae bacterium]|nr:ion transporter [Lachnospiraceae bacterium]